MAEPVVDVAWGSLNRAWRKTEYEELWLQFRPRGSKDVLDAVEAAVEVANQVVEDAGWGDETFTEGASESDAGAVALMSRACHEPGVRSWLGAFAHHLEALGKAGKVTAAPTAYFPDWTGGEVDWSRHLTAFVSYSTIDLTSLEKGEQERGWHVPADLTGQITDRGVAWGRFPGADVYLLRNIHRIRTRNPDVGRALADGGSRFGLANVTYLRSQPRRRVSMSLGTQGSAFYRLIRYHTHLMSQYTPDAHGLQILTDSHLRHANDLSDWVIDPLGGGRHLVAAKNPERWYANPDPDPETLLKARADFGKMILTPQTIEDNPPPWS